MGLIRSPKLALVVLMMMGSLVGGADVASASTSCAGFDTRFTGRAYDASYKVRGAQSDIQVRTGALCTGSGYTHVSAWSMVSGRDSGCRYAQVGFLRERSSSDTTVERFFWEYDNEVTSLTCPNFVHVQWGDPVSGNSYNFMVDREADGNMHMRVDGLAKCGQSGQGCGIAFDPLSLNNPIGEWFDESLDTGNDVPGTTAAPVYFSEVQHQNDNEDWVYQNWNLSAVDFGVNYCAYRTIEDTSNSQFHSFTDRGNC